MKHKAIEFILRYIQKHYIKCSTFKYANNKGNLEICIILNKEGYENYYYELVKEINFIRMYFKGQMIKEDFYDVRLYPMSQEKFEAAFAKLYDWKDLNTIKLLLIDKIRRL